MPPMEINLRAKPTATAAPAAPKATIVNVVPFTEDSVIKVGGTYRSQAGFQVKIKSMSAGGFFVGDMLNVNGAVFHLNCYWNNKGHYVGTEAMGALFPFGKGPGLSIRALVAEIVEPDDQDLDSLWAWYSSGRKLQYRHKMAGVEWAPYPQYPAFKKHVLATHQNHYEFKRIV